MRGLASLGVLGVLIWRLIASDKRYIDLASLGGGYTVFSQPAETG